MQSYGWDYCWYDCWCCGFCQCIDVDGGECVGCGEFE